AHVADQGAVEERILGRGVRALDAFADPALFSLLRVARVRRVAVAVRDRHPRARLALLLLYRRGVPRGNRSRLERTVGGGACPQSVFVRDVAAGDPAASDSADVPDARELSDRDVQGDAAARGD